LNVGDFKKNYQGKQEYSKKHRPHRPNNILKSMRAKIIEGP